MEKKSKKDQASKNIKQIFSLGVVPVGLAVIFTLMVKFVDVGPIGPEGSSVGFAGVNEALRPTENINELWYTISNWAWPILIAIVGFYAIYGLVQLIRRKSFAKVDKRLWALAGFYVAMILVYIIFEKLIVINYRPMILGGELEPSYPSSHTLFTMCICGSAIMMNKRLFKNKYINFVNAGLVFLGAAIIVTRFLSGVHWFSDICGGIVIGSAMLSLFSLALKFVKNKKPANE